MKIQYPFVVSWTGGDDRSAVEVRLIISRREAPDTPYVIETTAPAGDGSVYFSGSTITSPIGFTSPYPSGPVEIVISQTPGSTPFQPFAVPGLDFGAEQSWRYVWRYLGLSN